MNRTYFSSLLLVGLLSLSFRGLLADEAQSPQSGEFTADQLDHFNQKVLPVLKSNCLKCHSGSEPKGELDLTTREGILKGGESGSAVDLKDHTASVLVMAVNFEGYEMPPTGQMSPAQIESIEKWVQMGVPWPRDLEQIEVHHEPGPPRVNEETKKFWSFQPVRVPVVPNAQGAWAKNEIDHFILQKLEAAGLQPSPRAEPRQLIRRAYYDLTGLPPSLDEVEAFASDPSEAAWAAVVERLLDSPHYGEQWGRHWLDLVRYAETNSYERDGLKPHIWRYRDYIIQSFNDNKPYDQFITEQLAGDELPDRNADSLIATGYYRLGRWDDEPVDPELAFYDDIDDILTTTGQTFLGLTINCARCHDHKIDPMPQRDYYRMLAFFRNVRRYGERSEESVKAASVVDIERPENSSLHAAAMQRYEKEMKDIEQFLARIESRIQADLNGVENDEFQYETNRVALVEKRSGGLLTEREVKRYASLTQRRNYLREHRPSGLGQALCVKEDTRYKPTFVLLRGSPQAPGDEVVPGFPEVLSPPDAVIPQMAEGAQSSGRRTVLANWIASPDNPLTSRVMVNRIWQYHFGRGIVRSSSDFGFQGNKPSHPELLDWLAAKFVEEGWSIKQMHRLIMMSAAYQMSSAPRNECLAADPTNELFWRFDMRRLTAEEIRDSILWANGTLNSQSMFGPSIYTKIPAEVMAGQSRPGAGWGESTAEERARRSIYIHVKRSLLDPVLEAFDFADTDQSCPVRFATTQPTQALGLMNSDFAHEQATEFAVLLTEEAGSELPAQVKLALSRVLQRHPSEDEITRGLDLIKSLSSEYGMTVEQARVYFCLVALNLNEFIYLD
ncbi:MAG: PSD1 domain-containing protein [Planctomycetaceae bacterium]|nr:PSD1 domain-containing protein [Planctomycetaceae bacterium]